MATGSRVTLTYGMAKRGKTGDVVYSFPKALYIGLEQALASADWVGAGKLNRYHWGTLGEILSNAVPIIKAQKPPAVVIDDLTVIVTNTSMRLQGTYSDGRQLHGVLRELATRLFNACREQNCHVIMTAHEQPSKMTDNGFVRGGPSLPGKLAIEIPGLVDKIFHVLPEKQRASWPYIYACDPEDREWVMGDRDDVCPTKAPMNLAEIFRASGLAAPRLPGLEWQEQWIEQAAGMILEAPKDEIAILTEAEAIFSERTKNPLYVNWGLRDIADRAALRRLIEAKRATQRDRLLGKVTRGLKKPPAVGGTARAVPGRAPQGEGAEAPEGEGEAEG